MNSIRPITVLEEQVRHIQWLRSKQGVEYANSYLMEMEEESDLSHQRPFNEDWTDMDLSEQQALALDRADTFWVSRDMIRLVEHSAQSLPDSKLSEIDLPTRSGFVWLEEPWRARDIHDQECLTRAFMWAPTRLQFGSQISTEISGVWVCFYSWKDDSEHDESVLAAAAYKRQKLEDFIQPLPRLMLLQSFGWAFGMKAPPEENAEVTLSQKILTFWRLVQQRLPRQERAQKDRGTTRRLARMGTTLRQEEVRMITLRQQRPTSEANGSGDSEEVLWSHRWVVSGHWRNQYYPSTNEHRPIWINSYVKGPDDRPLVVKDTVFSWRR